MGYRIEYSKPTRRKAHFWLLTGVFFLLFICCVYRFWPEGAAVLRRWLIPQALETFVQSLKDGAGIGDAVAAFGQELTDGQ